MSAPEAAYFPAFEARCRALEDQRPEPQKLTPEQIAILELCARVQAIEAGNALKAGSAISES